jgi:hypothetical protein
MKRFARFLHRQWLCHRLRQAQADINQIERDRAHLAHALDYALRESTRARAALWYLDHPPLRRLARMGSNSNSAAGGFLPVRWND